MTQIGIILLTAWAAGLTAFLGGIIASIEKSPETKSKREIVHGVIAFGGGILVAAVAFSLAPEGITLLNPLVLTAVFSLGGGLFCIIDAYLSKRGGSKAQFMAMLMDFVPEAISLGKCERHNCEAPADELLRINCTVRSVRGVARIVRMKLHCIRLCLATVSGTG